VKNFKTTTTLKAFLWLGIYVCLIVSIGCMAPKLMPLSDEDKEMYKIYSDSELKHIKHKRLWPVESYHCKRLNNFESASYKIGLKELAREAHLLGGNALTGLECTVGGTSIPKNCWESIKCTATAINIGNGSLGKTRVDNDDGEPKQVTQSGTGSGFFVSKVGHVITNAHVVQSCKKVTIGDSANKQVPAEVINTDGSNDLALLKLSNLNMASAESKSLIQKLSIVVVPLASKGLLRSEDVKLGEKVMVAGYPFGDAFSNTIKVTSGIVSATRGTGDNSGQFQLDAAVQPGNSGGPIYGSGGNIVGVVVSQLNKKTFGGLVENINFGIKASTVRQFLVSSGLSSKKAEQTEEKSTEQLAEIAKNQALMVMCLQ
jgi:S1-C subfamily serine protease